LEELTTNTIIGDGLDKEIAYGPVLNSSVSDRVKNQIKDALSKGGNLISGGFKPTEQHLINGNFFRPTLIDNAPLDSLPMTDESYGPLAAIASFETENEMLEMANGLEYGLAAYIYGTDLERVWLLAEQLDFGAVGINVNDTSELQAPFGGWKMSGVGRELGPEGLMPYLEPKHLKMKLG
jgi:acyl-CoA reductase-like NAD-dependent aldehyde dehydrogenase